mgnify:CR=1 FL=1
MVSQFSLQQLAGGISPGKIANQRREQEAQNALLKILQQQGIQQNQAGLRGIQLDNEVRQRALDAKPQNQFKTITGKDGNSYQVEVAPNGQYMGQPKLVGGLGQKPNDNPLDKVPEEARKYLPPELIADRNSVDRATFNKHVIAAIGKARSEPPKADRDKQFDQAGKLRGEINKATEDFRKIETAYGRVQASAEVPSAAGDMALIFNYMKILDPGSTVREGEFATAQNAGGVDSKVRNVFNKVRNGQMLDESQRKDFLSRAEKLYQNQKSIADKRTENIVKIGGRFGIGRDDLLSPSVEALSDADLDAAIAALGEEG